MFVHVGKEDRERISLTIWKKSNKFGLKKLAMKILLDQKDFQHNNECLSILSLKRQKKKKKSSKIDQKAEFVLDSIPLSHTASQVLYYG